ncbi:multidrug resistance-associated protein 1, partial [Achlya hypogyna]
QYDQLVTPSRYPIDGWESEAAAFTPTEGKDANSGLLVVEEERAEGRVSMAVLASYLRAVGGLPIVSIVLVLTVGMQLLKVGSDLWLTHWATGANAQTYTDFAATSVRNLGIYGGLAFGSCLLVTAQSYAVVYFGIVGSQRMFEAMMQALLAAPMRFFDTNPIGRILNRCGEDVTFCDANIPFSLGPILFEVSTLLATVGTAMALTQWLGLGVVPLLYIYVKLAAYFMAPLREVNRIKKTARSPLISFVSEGLDGATTIRAFGSAYLQRFYRLNDEKVEALARARVVDLSINAWFSIRMQLISTTIVAVTLLATAVLHDSMSAGMIGLLVSYSLSIPSTFTYIVAIWANLEITLIAPERIHEYIQLESEGARETSMALPADWPATGKVEFADVSFRYKPTDPLVLKNVSFAVAGGEKIGIVGRTGAGKSSLMMALFRMNDVAGGKVAIDGVDIATVGLKTLRSHLAIIPQNPVLFKGTLRNYLDPFEEYTDEQLWAALAKVQMTDRVSADDGKLLGPVDENGENFSVGERQMLCMARALLRQAKVVVLDEATAAIDHETDKVLQRVIRTEFAASTVLTIAHRLDTVLDCDRIMVFDQGTLVQCDAPKTLVDAGDGIFYELVTEGGYMDKMTI